MKLKCKNCKTEFNRNADQLLDCPECGQVAHGEYDQIVGALDQVVFDPKRLKPFVGE